MKKFKDITLYISSFIPLYFLVIVKELIEIANGNLSFNVINTVMLSLNLLLIILSVVGVILSLKQDKSIPKHIGIFNLWNLI